MAEELLKDLNGSVAEVSVAQRDEQVVLQTGEDNQPLVQLLVLEVLL